MSDLMLILIDVIIGGLLGIIFFGGLWLTVTKAVVSKRPELWFILSSLVRVGITLAGFYLASQGHWQRLVACLIGFILSRFIVNKWIAIKTKDTESNGETSHAHQS
jgi:F1F0 ATPase subunit 2